MKKPKRTAPTVEYRNPFMEIRHSRADFGTHSKDYYVVHFGPRVGVVAVRDGAVLMTSQYRYLIDAPSWEIPGGKIDEGETPAQAGARECREETGIACRALEPLIVYYPGLDNVENRTTILYTRDVDATASRAPDRSEIQETRWIPLAECLEMIARQEIMDALTVVGLLAYARLPQQSAKR